MHTSSLKQKTWLVNQIVGKACWCSQVAELFCEDMLNLRCSEKLHALAQLVHELPDHHPLFEKLEQIQRIGGDARERWLDEIQIEFANIGYLAVDDSDFAIQRLTEITDNSLWEQHPERPL